MDFLPENYNFFFGPSLIYTTDSSFNSYLKKTLSHNNLIEKYGSLLSNMGAETLKAKAPSLYYFLNTNNIHDIKPYVTSINQGLVLNSLADRSMQFMVLGAIHRLTQIASQSVNKRINNSELPFYIKFICSTAVTITPYVIMELLGYPSMELMAVSGIQIASQYLPYIISNTYNFVCKKQVSKEVKKSLVRYGSIVREVDLISDYQKFNLSNIALKNTISFIRYLSSTIIINKIGTGSILQDRDIRDKASFGICKRDKAISYFGYGVSNFRFNLVEMVFTEIGWSTGRLLIDITFGILNKVCETFGIKYFSDLKDPFHSADIDIMGKGLVNKQKKEKREEDIGSNSITTSSLYANLNVGVTKKKVEKKSYEEEKKEEIKSAATKYKNPEVITLQGYEEHKLYPVRLNADIANSIVFCVIDNVRAVHFKNFTTSLSKADVVSSNGWVEALSYDRTYCIRDKGQDSRMVGVIYTGNDAVYNQLHKIYDTYEAAIDVTNRIQAITGGVPKLIVFSRETTHAQMNPVAQGISERL